MAKYYLGGAHLWRALSTLHMQVDSSPMRGSSEEKRRGSTTFEDSINVLGRDAQSRGSGAV